MQTQANQILQEVDINTQSFINKSEEAKLMELKNKSVSNNTEPGTAASFVDSSLMSSDNEMFSQKSQDNMSPFGVKQTQNGLDRQSLSTGAQTASQLSQDTQMDKKLNKLEDQLYQYLFLNLSQSEMNSYSKFFLVPIGLPGMGKTTLSRFLSATTQNNQKQFGNLQQNYPKIQNFSKRTGGEAQPQLKIEFLKISYDRILTQNQQDYCEQHPEVSQHEAIDIIRGKADQDYLDAITFQCDQQDGENKSENSIKTKEIVYLDRNNTPDVWADIQKTITKANKNKKQREFKTVLIVPEQHPEFDASQYQTQNPICPQMIFECIKRIFGRKDHTCLSSENKPKVVEVILKFAKLYDGVDLSKDDVLRSHFDDFVRLDFLGFSERQNLLPETIKALTHGYNQTPPNFQCPSDEVINSCIEAVEKQIEYDEKHAQADGPSQIQQ